MKINGIVIFVYTLAIITVSCSKEEEYVAAQLYYTTNCATIKGYVILESDSTVYTFRHEIEERFRKEKINVLISFDLVPEPTLFTTDCFTNPLININFIKEN